jgi:hypothetical protein
LNVDELRTRLRKMSNEELTHGVWAIDGQVKPGVAFKKKKPEVQAEPERSGLCGVDPGPPLEIN